MCPGRRWRGTGRVAITAAALLGTFLGHGAPALADDGRDHEIRLPVEDRAVTGAQRVLSLTIAPLPGYTISRDGPLLVDLSVDPRASQGDGLHLPRRRYQRGDAADARAEAPRFDLRYQAGAPGRHTLTVHLRFWVCARRTCRPVHASRDVMIEVTAPGPDASVSG
jgi:hypothetical protein